MREEEGRGSVDQSPLLQMVDVWEGARKRHVPGGGVFAGERSPGQKLRQAFTPVPLNDPLFLTHLRELEHEVRQLLNALPPRPVSKYRTTSPYSHLKVL